VTIASERAIKAAKMCIQRKRETLCMCRYPVMDVRCAPSKTASKAMVSQNYSTHCSGEGLTGGESRWQIGQQCKNESAPDSIECGTPVDQPSPESCSLPPYAPLLTGGMAPMSYCGNVAPFDECHAHAGY
jgi:hypothetical protein